jgi:hypothetical protein
VDISVYPFPLHHTLPSPCNRCSSLWFHREKSRTLNRGSSSSSSKHPFCTYSLLHHEWCSIPFPGQVPSVLRPHPLLSSSETSSSGHHFVLL